MAKRNQSTEERVKKYEALIRRLEVYAAENPSGYRTRVFLLYLLGIGYALFWLVFATVALLYVGYLCITGSITSPVKIKVVLLLLGMIFLILRSFWVPLPPLSTGVILNRDNASVLFELLDDIRIKLNTPAVYQVHLDGQFNASAEQRPRFGMFGGTRNYLWLGLPLIDALSPEQFRFVIGHELGHYSRHQTRFGLLIYKAEAIWYQLINNFRNEAGQSDVIFGTFYRWFVPYFSAYTYALRRHFEFEADRFAVQYSSSQAAGTALTTLELQGRWIDEKVWKRLTSDMAEQAELPDNVYLQIAEALKRPIPEELAGEWLTIALQQKTDYDDSHPSLTDRLLTIGYRSESLNAMELITERPAESAAQTYLGVNLPYLRQEVEEVFRQFAVERWKTGHEETLKLKTKLLELEQKAQVEALLPDELLELGGLYECFNQTDRAVDVARTALERDPNNVHAEFHLGRMMLEEKREEGISYIESAMQRERDYFFSGCQIIYGYLLGAGRSAEADTYKSRYYAGADDLKEMEEERKALLPTDVIAPAAVDAAFLAELCVIAEGIKQVREILIVRKEVKIFPDEPCYYVYLDLKIFPNGKEAESANSVIQQLHSSVVWPFEHYVFTSLYHKGYYKRLQTVAGATVYKRDRRRR